VRAITDIHRKITAPMLSVICVGVFGVSLGGCAEYYTDTTSTPESRYNTYYGPDYYPYYPYYSYYGGAYYSGD